MGMLFGGGGSSRSASVAPRRMETPGEVEGAPPPFVSTRLQSRAAHARIMDRGRVDPTLIGSALGDDRERLG
jgi:hypothetical protein